jgi:hypothetical protein
MLCVVPHAQYIIREGLAQGQPAQHCKIGCLYGCNRPVVRPCAHFSDLSLNITRRLRYAPTLVHAPMENRGDPRNLTVEKYGAGHEWTMEPPIALVVVARITKD